MAGDEFGEENFFDGCIEISPGAAEALIETPGGSGSGELYAAEVNVGGGEPSEACRRGDGRLMGVLGQSLHRFPGFFNRPQGFSASESPDSFVSIGGILQSVLIVQPQSFDEGFE